MEKLIKTFLDGNIAEAKERAKDYTRVQIQDCLNRNYDYSKYKSLLIALFLKDLAVMSEVLDAE